MKIVSIQSGRNQIILIAPFWRCNIVTNWCLSIQNLFFIFIFAALSILIYIWWESWRSIWLSVNIFTYLCKTASQFLFWVLKTMNSIFILNLLNFFLNICYWLFLFLIDFNIIFFFILNIDFCISFLWFLNFWSECYQTFFLYLFICFFKYFWIIILVDSGFQRRYINLLLMHVGIILFMIFLI